MKDAWKGKVLHIFLTYTSPTVCTAQYLNILNAPSALKGFHHPNFVLSKAKFIHLKAQNLILFETEQDRLLMALLMIMMWEEQCIVLFVSL